MFTNRFNLHLHTPKKNIQCHCGSWCFAFYSVTLTCFFSFKKQKKSSFKDFENKSANTQYSEVYKPAVLYNVSETSISLQQFYIPHPVIEVSSYSREPDHSVYRERVMECSVPAEKTQSHAVIAILLLWAVICACLTSHLNWRYNP